MNYFEFHLGDYAQATSHLTFVEDAAYMRLLRKYYAEEKPLPADLAATQRLAGARTPEEKEAVEIVLGEFFELQEDGWHNRRADEEIEEYQSKQEGKKAEKEAEAERKRRYRERRQELFAELREHGVVPAFDTPTSELVTLLERQKAHTGDADGTRTGTGTGRGTGTGQPAGQDADRDAPGTGSARLTQTPVPSPQSPEDQKLNLVQQAARVRPRFAEFWAVYPVKKGKAEAEKKWHARNLDVIADKIIADVEARKKRDRQWRAGYAPHGSTYVNQRGWEDEIEEDRGRNGSGLNAADDAWALAQ